MVTVKVINVPFLSNECIIKMLKSTVAGVVRKVVPRVFWRRRFSILRQSIPSRKSEEQELRIVPLLCDKTKTSIDIGASEGVYTIVMIDASRDCWTFEPRLAQTFELREMVEYLSLPVRIEAVALSDRQGEAKLRILERDVGRSTIEPDNVLEDPDGSATLEITIPTRRLDDYKLDVIGFIKIDVEGHELSVLRGGSETIRRCLPTMLIEIEERHKPNSIRDVSEFLSELGYEGYFILNRNLMPMKYFDTSKYQDSGNIGGWKTSWKRSGIYINNFFFVPTGVRSRLEAAVGRLRESLLVNSPGDS
jgi:FkbM family methyltransferase